MRMRSRCLHALALSAALLSAGTAGAQTQCPVDGSTAISCPNQISGTVRLTSSNPAILDALAASGPAQARVGATAVGLPLGGGTISALPGDAVSAPYQVTVQGGDPGGGILYDVTPYLDRGAPRNAFYRFNPLRSAPVELEPAPDVQLDFAECAGLLDIRFVDGGGNPVAVQGGRIKARLPLPGGGWGDSQAGQDIPGGSTAERLPVRGDGTLYRLEVFVTYGSDPYSDLVTVQQTADVAATCDQVVPVTIPLRSADLGRIVGQVDVLGVQERAVKMTADDGPFGNYRYDNPAGGSFELENLVTADAVDPPLGYQTFAHFAFNPDRRLEIFEPPYLDFYNPGSRPLTAAGQTTDLGDTFVINPGTVAGQVELLGPPAGANGGSCLAGMPLGGSSDLNLILAGIGATGTSEIAPGATKNAFRGNAGVAFDGAFDAASHRFLGDYELLLGGLHGESSIWDVQKLTTFIGSSIITDLSMPSLTIVPGQRQQRDFRYCFSEVNLGFRSTSGVFTAPRAYGLGSFQGTDFLGRTANYTMSELRYGENIPLYTPSNRGLVTMCMPQGTYTLNPLVNSVNPDGTSNENALPPVTFTVGCGQVVDLSLGLQLSLDSLPRCSATAPRLTGKVAGSTPVDSITATANGGPASTFCANCGTSPAFDFTAPAAQCDARIVVTAQGGGETASATAFTRIDGTAPTVSGCQDVTVEVDPGTPGASVPFSVGTADNCDANLPAACDHASGSFFGMGTTAVTCGAVDTCGNRGTCTFHVTVKEKIVNTCRPVTPDVRTQGFWKQQCKDPNHPSGEPQKLPSYVAPVATTATFASTHDVPSLCAELNPQPQNDKCQQAEAQLMALLLNQASGRIAACNCVNDPSLGRGQVGPIVHQLDGLLANPRRTAADCTLVQSVADRMNNGTTFVPCQ